MKYHAGIRLVLHADLKCRYSRFLQGGGSVERRERDDMTMDEVGRQYQIPRNILEEYERWGSSHGGRNVTGAWQYDDYDLENLSMMMTLQDIGFAGEEVETYMGLVLQGTDSKEERLRFLEQKRHRLLDEIHFQENKLDRLDYLRYEIKTFAQSG